MIWPMMVASQDGGVLIFGGTRNTGLEIAKILVARGDQVTAFVRPTSDLSGLDPLGVNYAVGDALNFDDVLAVLNSGTYRAVISTIGSSPRAENPVDYTGTVNIVEAAKVAGVERLLAVTIIGPGKSISMVPEEQRITLAGAIALKAKAEDHIIASGLDYTIVRPGQLTHNPANRSAKLSLDPGVTGPLTRADLAGLVVDCLDNDATIGQIYQAIGDDPLARQGIGLNRSRRGVNRPN